MLLQSADTTKRIFLWGSPRSLSTAFQFSVATLANVKTFFEPYSIPYFSQSPCDYGPKPTLDSYDDVDEMLLEEYPDKEVIFIKESPHKVRGRYEVFLNERFTHSFLIRNPQRAVLSHYRALQRSMDNHDKYFIEACKRGDIGFVSLCEFYFFLKSKLNIDPIIIDADDLLANPEKMMKVYCDRVGLTFKEGMTRWEPYSGLTPNFKDQMVFDYEWVDSALKSSGFQDLTPLPSLPDDIPHTVRKCVDECFVPYNKLYSLRITV